jgi:MEMO1 family protein
MRRINGYLILILLAFTMGNTIFSQPRKNLVDQKPVVAGQFYPAKPGELRSLLNGYFSSAKPVSSGEVIAIISPHAGYVFSGQIAATAIKQADAGKEYKTIFVIGSSHKMLFDGASIYNKGNFITPLGTVKVDLDLADKIIRENSVFISKPDAFSSEHSIEVQLPFLQVHFKKDFRIIPVIIGSQDPSVSKKIAEALLPFFNDENLFIFSSDFSHYPDYQNANSIDKLTAEALTSKSPEKFLKTLQANAMKDIPNLATSACAWPALLSLLYMAEETPGSDIQQIAYKNSGDTNYGDKTRVVGYNAMIVTYEKRKKQSSNDFALSETDKKVLLEIARNSIDSYLTNNRKPNIDPVRLSENLKTKAGAFVTLTKKGNLRGCIGRFTGDSPLYQIIQDMAVASAVNDYRFDKVSIPEMKEIDIEISVLSPLKKIKSIDEIVMGKHGIYITKGMQSGTFLPQVAIQTGWTKEEFLGHCARDKAKIGWEGWKNAEIFTYEAFVFGEKDTHE